MAKTFVIEEVARDAACNAIVDLLDVGGTTANLVIATTSSAVDLVTIPLGAAAAFGAAATGVCTMTATSPTAAATGTGTAVKFRLEDDNASPVKVASGNVGVGTQFTLDITNTSIATSDVITITNMTVTVPAS